MKMNYNLIMGKILVTGATGFVGRRLMPMLVKKYGKGNIICLVKDKLSELEVSGRQELDLLGVKYMPTDLGHCENVIPDLGSVKTVIHMAANTNTADINQEININGTINLFKIIKNITKDTHIIYTSSAAIFAGRRDCRVPVDRSTLPCPTSKYGRTKLQSEKYLLQQQAILGFRLTIIRPTTIYGSNPRPDSMFNYINRSLSINSWFIRLDWPGKTGLIEVGDVANAIFKSVSRTKRFEVFNLASEAPTFSQIVDAVANAKGIKLNKIFMPRIFWEFCRKFRNVIYGFENYLPLGIYNLLWRSTLIIDDVIYCDKDELQELGIIKTKMFDRVLQKIIDFL